MSHMFEEMSGSQPVCHVVPVFGADQFPLKAGWVNTRRRRKSKRPHRLAKRQRQAVASLPEKVYPVEYAKVELRGFKVLKALFPNAGSDRIVSGLREAALLPYPERVARMCAKLSEESVVGGGLSRSRTEPSPAPLKVEVPTDETAWQSGTLDFRPGCSSSFDQEAWWDWQDNREYWAKRDKRRSRVEFCAGSWAALRFPVPKDAIVNAIVLARAALSEVAEAEEEEHGEATKPKSFQQVQHQFLQQHQQQIVGELGQSVVLDVATVGHSVQTSFMDCLRGSVHDEPVLAYHGTALSNIPRILDVGLRIPGSKSGVRVVHGSAHGVGIYTAKEGNASLSRGFCNSDNMLVCGVIDNDPEPEEVVIEMARDRQIRLRPAHRATRKPQSVTQAAARPLRMFGALPMTKDGAVRHVGGAMVIFDEARVAPLFVARNFYGAHPTPLFPQSVQCVTLDLLRPNPNCARQGQVGRNQYIVGDERLFESWQPGSYHRNTKTVKRRMVAKDRSRLRMQARAIKTEFMP
mmetsp:Transcript_71914/g.164914  ORF Transcript_71914/g.164914 Transcript_71914/m.164914 type:complete len:520 (+) Transcript_71914:29-1588(+)